MANQRTTNKTTPPTYKKHTNAAGQKTEISNNNGKVTTKVTQKSGDYAIKVVDNGKTYYKTFDKSGKETTGKSTEAKVTTPKKLTTEQTDKIPFKNDAINKFSDKVYPIWQGLERNEIIDSKGNTRQPVRTAINKKEAQKPWLYQSTMYGTKEQRDSSRAVVTGTNLVKTPAGVIFKIPTKKDPLVKPGNTGKGALVRRTSAENNAQMRANKKLTGKTGDGY